MQFPNIDVYEIYLFFLVAKHNSFTLAAKEARLTQSAVSRQIQGLERKTGVFLFERTTRAVLLTVNGEKFLSHCRPMVESFQTSLQELLSSFKTQPKTIRVGVARSIGLGYFPGFFKLFLKKYPDVKISLVSDYSNKIIHQIETSELDVGLVYPKFSKAMTLEVSHRFPDPFTIILSPHIILPDGFQKLGINKQLAYLNQFNWLLISPQSNTRPLIDKWLVTNSIDVETSLDVDSFDLIVNLISTGFGVSIVPTRTLPLYSHNRAFKKVKISPVLSREVVVLSRKTKKQDDIVKQFVHSIAF